MKHDENRYHSCYMNVQADREADQAHREECFASLAQVVIKEKLDKTSDVLNT